MLFQDLSYLNRDLSKVILLDTNPAHAKFQPENAIIIPKWKGDPKDKDLVSYIPFLEYIGANINERGKGDVDTRAILKSFEGVHIPTEYERRIEKLRAQSNKQMEEERGKRPKRSVGFWALSSARNNKTVWNRACQKGSSRARYYLTRYGREA